MVSEEYAEKYRQREEERLGQGDYEVWAQSVGSHIQGGGGLPHPHKRFEDRQTAESQLKRLRDRNPGAKWTLRGPDDDLPSEPPPRKRPNELVRPTRQESLRRLYERSDTRKGGF